MEKEVVYKCRKHGHLNIDGVIAVSDPALKKGFRYRCKACRHEYAVMKYAENREERIKYSVEWKKNNRLHVNNWNKEDKEKDPEKYKKWSKDYRDRLGEKRNAMEISRRRGIMVEKYYEMIEQQDNRCAICNEKEKRTAKNKILKLCVDHDHATGKVRQLLCHDCNTGLGKFKDNQDLLQSAIDYLKKHQPTDN